ncbi:uncharacterized protein LOC123556739 [Mercenaria mercenaria]|uniref:uncharacterized protein LOC123556739 n=1 Tax=Mercenaria mercenaria TaxID=6596 RepID=UPI00234E3B56|nr:uncharacterized protein LOC123556739 [Mercenaria mercenaria]
MPRGRRRREATPPRVLRNRRPQVQEPAAPQRHERRNLRGQGPQVLEPAAPQRQERRNPRIQGPQVQEPAAPQQEEPQRQEALEGSPRAQGDRRSTGRGQKRTHETLEEDALDDRVRQSNSDVWVLGDSIPYWAGVRARETGKEHLRLNGLTVEWLGVRGLHWSELRNQIEAKVLFSSPPSIIILHLGGNDITSSTTVQIKIIIREEITYLREAFPEATLIWVDILPRRTWRGATNLKTIEKKLLRLNRLGRQLVLSSGKADIVKPDIDTETNFFEGTVSTLMM